MGLSSRTLDIKRLEKEVLVARLGGIFSSMMFLFQDLQ
jgi:hypothetical protein